MIVLQAITTKFIGPTNSTGSRVKATARKAAGFSVVHHWDYGIANEWPGVNDVEGNHLAAARKLAEKLGWDGVWVMGGSPDETGYLFVNTGVRAGALDAESTLKTACAFAVEEKEPTQ